MQKESKGYFTVKEIYPWLYSIYDPLNINCYLIVGNDAALLFDVAYGIGDLPATVREITDKPLVVVLGHGHHDHVNGAYQFEEVLLHEADFSLCRDKSAPERRQYAINRLNEWKITAPNGFDPEAYLLIGPGNMKKLDIGRIFNLGDINVEVIGMEGHTPGSIGLLVKEKKVLLDSDSANPGTWLFLKESLPLSFFLNMAKRVKELDFDVYFAAHSGGPQPKSDFDLFIKAAYNATVEKSEPLTYMPGVTGYVYKEDGVGITFSVEKNDISGSITL